MKKIMIDGVEHVVHGITSERAGWCHLAVAPVNDRAHLVHSSHAVPSAWWNGEWNAKVRTSGHTYAKA